MIWTIAEKTGWTWQYILWEISWVNLQMMMADAPRLTKSSKKIQVDDEELAMYLMRE